MTTFFEFVKSQGKLITKQKGDYVFKQGDNDENLYFVQSGFLKAFYCAEHGKEFIKSFLLANDAIGSLSALYLKQESSFNLICLETTVLIRVSFNAILSHSKEDIEFANELNNILLMLALKKEKREYEFLCLTAEQRYKSIKASTPSLLDKITQSDLAAYLGITPVGLSRIKKRVESIC
ncbi:Crp/Fnr family transcriptional regulator [Thalassotalea sediminis]|uniref:Crp/Fnr family transcriptional regulator n=1 Tax=Thalassotalea sediminis TaxID=1759089 RepID=UPI0025748379|nr:Crp/Fnr family transcriptional regulator [Thalassotalea sediminis]